MRCLPVLGLAMAVTAAMGAPARAEPERPRSLWFECAVPSAWPVREGTWIRLSCRVELPAHAGPAFWQTINPFVSRRTELINPFTGELRDPFVGPGPRLARRRVDAYLTTAHEGRLALELANPFESALQDTVDPFQAPRAAAAPEPRAPAAH